MPSSILNGLADVALFRQYAFEIAHVFLIKKSKKRFTFEGIPVQ